jgi:pimeloyl-ACP methyl ester carboxylesterase
LACPHRSWSAPAAAPARFAELDGSGHVTYIERANEFAHAVGAFSHELSVART